MSENLLPLATFHLTAQRSGIDLDGGDRLELRPALFGAYQDLSKLRYDYPLVLVDTDGTFARPLSRIIDGILQEIAPRGIAGERLRKHVLALEREIRMLASGGNKGPLMELWDLAASALLSRAGESARESLQDSLERARRALTFDGELSACDQELPVRLLTHAWNVVQKDKARRFHDRLDELVVKLSDILRADFMQSDAARSPENLKCSVGTAYEQVFDFEAMSRILRKGDGVDSLPPSRRQRISSVLTVLESQRFFAPPRGRKSDAGRQEPHSFVFDRCTRALKAFHDRLPEVIALFKAIAIGELEVENRYKESKHDAFLSHFDERSLGPQDLALLPSYLVCVHDRRCNAEERAALMEVLAAGLPFKVLVLSDDILEERSISNGQLSFGMHGSQLAAMAVGLNNAFVLQSSSSCLYQLRDRILNGLSGDGPALYSVFSGAAMHAPTLPAYLLAAAAAESRAFPAFSYDPAAGGDWASRFRIEGNPQVEADWPLHRLSYEDQDLQRISQDVAFSFVDFVACDGRYAGHFARVPRAQWHDSMVPVDEFLRLDADNAADKVPYVLVVEEGNVLYRAIVEDKLIQAARHCREMWHNLQELGGINNSHARRLLATQRAAWEQQRRSELEALSKQSAQAAEVPAAAAPQQAPAAAPEPAAPAQADEAPADEPYIDTPRCTTCDECTEINSRMFAYDDNKQAYIADPDAGSYRELVEAAESCQVCIIHPGKPRNPDEPNLDELIKRAEPFN
ncbi:MAG: hypothetical protein BMS9Abin10_0492 [Gammaproteobacteria bacterium]|nr:MAG: hypothetical protein BMS9Abin10_0492 [Gammaproteobacteria bacterium]